MSGVRLAEPARLQTKPTTGAEVVVQTLADNGVRACFANPGTSEMQFVAALDSEPRIRPVLCLFEGVATGAADGYGRMHGGPACTLLHLGPGYANGAANLHNAARAGTPLVNVVGDHATYHRGYDAPLQSDIEGIAAPSSLWVRSADTVEGLGLLTAEAVQASFGPPGGNATLILPADIAWSGGAVCGPALPRPARKTVSDEAISKAVDRLAQAAAPAILIGGGACSDSGLKAAAVLAAAGVRVLTDTFLPRQARGAGRFAPDRMQYLGEAALADLARHDLLLLVETAAPVAFFAYPDRPSSLVPPETELMQVCGREGDGAAVLVALADAISARGPAAPTARSTPSAPAGRLSPASVGASVARHLPEHAVISDDSVTSGMPIFIATATAAPHDWLMLTGGAIGQGIPVAIGAAIACPGRKVISLNGDGAASYTVQGLWTIVREQLDVVVVVFANNAYRILGVELERTGGGGGAAARSLLSLDNPRIGWTSLARGYGMPAERCTTAEEFDRAFGAAMASEGPRLIEVAL